MGLFQQFCADQCKLPPLQKAVLQQLAELSDDRGLVFKTMDKILAQVKGDVMPAKYRAVQQLMEAGYVTTQVKMRPAPGQGLALYQIAFPKMGVLPPASLKSKTMHKNRVMRDALRKIEAAALGAADPDEAIAEILKIAQRTLKNCKFTPLENTEISPTGGETPGAVQSDHQTVPRGTHAVGV